MSRPLALDLRVYLVTDQGIASAAGHTLPTLVQAAVAGGVTTVQVREKDATAAAFLTTVIEIAAAVPEGVPVLVNDRVDVYLAARAAGAPVAGVHLGQSDLPATLVRTLIGEDAILGVSAATPEQLEEAAASLARIDYVGIGALHTTTTKRDAPPALGADGLARLLALSALPAVAIGGVTASDFPGIRRSGAAGGAVVSAICGAPDPRAAARELRDAWEAGA
ncbi:thiamine phosphate synthase [Humidisolicoccus flavus]|uniref:thiamine phosphate synthase n=1 Tax=Humidisolicoccus flavus TaxID=3111414 RepID=UPI00324C798A